MFIHSLQLKSFKGFSAETTTIIFNKPNGDLGSGLNIFIGENNCGKSTVLEAIDFLRNKSKKSESLLKFKNELGEQPFEAEVEVEFSGNIEEVILNFSQPHRVNVFKSRIYTSEDGHEKIKIKRTTQNAKIIELWDHENNIFNNETGLDSPLQKLFETNFIWADTNPHDETAFGITTICGYFLSEIVKNHKETKEYLEFTDNFHSIFNSDTSSLRKELATVENKIKEVFESQFGSAKIAFEFEELKIESFFKNMRVMVDDGIKVPMGEKGNGMQRSVALALIQVYAEIVAYDTSQEKSKPFYLFIDEPEICLHPKGQNRLLNALLKISKHQQVFVSTHSPYFLSTPYLENVGIHIFKKDGFKNSVRKANVDYLFPWSPTWGEINYQAYNLATVDFHNELFGYIQETIANKNNLKSFDQWLEQSHSIMKDKKWSKDGGSFEDVTLMHFIRNHIHHPENVHMKAEKYQQQDLETSISEMIKIIKVFEAQKKLAAVS